MNYLAMLQARQTEGAPQPSKPAKPGIEGFDGGPGALCPQEIPGESAPQEPRPKESRQVLKAAYHGFTLEQLRRECLPNEWEEDMQRNPDALESFALSLREERQRIRGIRPARWDRIAHCQYCGAINVPPFLEGQALKSCRWCENRGAKRPRPKPYPLPNPGTGPGIYSADLRPPAWRGIDD